MWPSPNYPGGGPPQGPPGPYQRPLQDPYTPAPNRRVNHPTIDPANLSQELARSPETHRFEEQHLSQVLMAVAANDFPSRLSRSQLQLLRSPIPDSTNDHAFRTRFMHEWCNLFDSAFFGGGLGGGRIELLLTNGLPGDRPGVISGARYGLFKPLEMRLYVNMTLQPPDEFLGSIEHMYLASMVHEMTHAFLSIYACKCDSCQFKVDPHQGGTGRGHGPPWADALQAIGIALAAQVPWPFHLGIEGGIALEQFVSNWQATPEQLYGWVMTPEAELDLVRNRAENNWREDPAGGAGPGGYGGFDEPSPGHSLGGYGADLGERNTRPERGFGGRLPPGLDAFGPPDSYGPPVDEEVELRNAIARSQQDTGAPLMSEEEQLRRALAQSQQETRRPPGMRRAPDTRAPIVNEDDELTRVLELTRADAVRQNRHQEEELHRAIALSQTENEDEELARAMAAWATVDEELARQLAGELNEDASTELINRLLQEDHGF